MSIFNTLNKAAEETKKTKKSSAVEVHNEDLEAACHTFVKASKDEKNAKAARAQASSELIDFLSPVHGEALKNNSLTRTFRINDKVMCTFGDRFGTLGPEDVEDAQTALQEAKVPFDRLFREKAKFVLKKSIEDNEKLLEELVGKLGEDFTKYFDVSTEVVPVDDFYKAVSREGCYDELKDVIERIRYKPTVKVS